jgi:phage-related tail fiber protein
MSNLSIKRVLALPSTLDASTMYIVKSPDTDLVDLYFSTEDGSAVRRIITKNDIEALFNAMMPDNVERLTNARHITATGDATWDVIFDGSADVSAVLTLAETGVTAGEYVVMTCDSKGRITSGRNLTASDVPNLPGSKIISDISVNTTGNAATADEADKLSTARLINGVSFDGTADITINAEDSTPRIAASEKGQANGVATLDGDGKVPAAQLPSYVDDVVEAATFSALPATGETSKIYVTLDNNKTYRWGGSAYVEIPSGVGTSDSALKLTNPRNITITGDASWTVSFDGSANVSAALTLANSGVTAGEYPVVTVDAKGRVTDGRALVEADLPNGITSAKVASAASITLAASEW